ncbi:glycosyl transferase group 1 [Selenomonas sputigena ATCC 35185]|uniref:Glycosyl transferase group 1 n=1 Tax=Selenomonas sputigena (strain ATCC 35185 / DSM 20758 / CCUG 44933 / VPI D19B-28) TaxID=546271 RepID=F4EWQ0_SELS3|nr:glycosyl transferase group 1 [Selenomonas sputigena ATCC 35185]
MNILYDSQIFFQQRYGGISRYFYELIRNMIKEESILLHEGVNINAYGLRNLCAYKKFWGYHIKRNYRLRALISKINAFHFRYFIRNENVDIYHPTYYTDYEVHGAKKVVTVYDMIHELFPQDFLGDRTAEEKAKILRNADGIIAISESTKKDLMRLLDISAEKIRVIYLANSLSESVQDVPVMKGPYLLYVGNRSGYKNFMGLAQAFAGSQYKNDVQLVCFGGGEFTKSERESLIRMGIWERTVYCSGGDDVLSNLYQFASAFVYPSIYEGFGLPLLEAMHHGTLVLTGATSSIPEVAGDAAEYFNPNEPESIREVMDRLLSDSDRRQELRARGRAREKMFSWQRCAEETLDFYRVLR